MNVMPNYDEFGKEAQEWPRVRHIKRIKLMGEVMLFYEGMYANIHITCIEVKIMNSRRDNKLFIHWVSCVECTHRRYKLDNYISIHILNEAPI